MVELRPDLWFDVYPYNNPKAGARLVRLTSEQLLGGSYFRVERRGTGAGQVVLNSGQAEFTAANLHEENLVEVGDANVSATDPLGGFFLHRGDLEIISSDEKGGENFPIGGPGLLAYLAREIMWSRTYITTGGAMDPFDDLWRLGLQGLWAGGRRLGAFAWRAVTECLGFQAGPYTHKHGDGLVYTDTHPDEDRLSSAISLLSMDFDQDTDSAGNAWTPYEGEFNARVKQQLLSVILDLVGKGMDVQMRGGRQLLLSAYNSYGRDFRGSAFGAGVVRFAHGENIANPARRAIEAGLNGSRALVGSGDVYAIANAPGGYHVQRSVGLDSDAEETAGLVIDGEANLRAREAGSDVPALKVLYGNDPATGRYLFAPPEVGGHAWVGDLVTIHRGAGAFQWNNADARIEAITFELTDDKVWDDPTVEFGSVYRSADERGRAAAVQAIAGKPHGPHIRLCPPARAGGAASCLLSPGDMSEIPTPNGDFETGDPTNWSGVTAAHITAGDPSGSGGSWYATVNALSPQWEYHGWLGQTFVAGVTYVFRAWIIASSRLHVGDIAAGDYVTSDPLPSTPGEGWACVEWTPSATRTAVKAVQNFNAAGPTPTASGTLVIDNLQAYTGGSGSNPLNGTSSFAARCDKSEHEVLPRNPTANDDAAHGYPRRTLWHNSATGATFISTDGSAGAAVWASLVGGLSEAEVEAIVDAAIADHASAGDPHPDYLTEAEHDALAHASSGGGLPLTAVVNGEPVLLWDENDSLIGAS